MSVIVFIKKNRFWVEVQEKRRFFSSSFNISMNKIAKITAPFGSTNVVRNYCRNYYSFLSWLQKQKKLYKVSYLQLCNWLYLVGFTLFRLQYKPVEHIFVLFTGAKVQDHITLKFAINNGAVSFYDTEQIIFMSSLRLYNSTYEFC